VHSHPSISINNHTYIGDFTGPDIYRAICASFAQKPFECKQGNMELLRGMDYDYKLIDANGQTLIRDMFIVGLLLMVVMSAMVFIHRSGREKKAKTEI
jgi:hypothetical protein